MLQKSFKTYIMLTWNIIKNAHVDYRSVLNNSLLVWVVCTVQLLNYHFLFVVVVQTTAC